MLNPNDMDMDLDSYFDDETDGDTILTAVESDKSESDMEESINEIPDVNLNNIEQNSDQENDEELLDSYTFEEQLKKMKFTNMDLTSFVSFLQKEEFMRCCIYNVDVNPILHDIGHSSGHEIQNGKISKKYTPLLIQKNIHNDSDFMLANIYSNNLFPVIENYHSGVYTFKVLSEKGIAYKQFYGKNFGLSVYVPFNRSRKIVGFYKQIGNPYETNDCVIKHIVIRSDLPVNKDDLVVLRNHRDMDEELTGSDIVSSTKYKRFERKVKDMKTIGDYVKGLTDAYNEAKNPNQIRAILDIYEDVLYL